MDGKHSATMIQRILQIGICLAFFIIVSNASEMNEESSLDGESPWSPWGNWSDCSRDCGGGIAYQRRECLYGTCGGSAVKYRTCNTESCDEGTPDFRNRQCEAFNDVQYNGQVYTWTSVAGLPADTECSLVCKASGHNLTETLSRHVLDGTPCREGSRDMCLNGTCVPIGCDYGFNSTLSLDQCLVCGGDNSSCKLQTRRKISTREVAGLEELWFLPKGSFSIKIVMITGTRSLLGVKLEDGSDGINQRISAPSGYYTVGGVDLEYRRKRKGRPSIFIPGSLDKNFWITVTRMNSRKAGEAPDKVIFQYMTPVYYIWRLTDWSTCSKSCSSGFQEQTWACHDKLTGEVVDESRCQKKKPQEQRRTCNVHPCPPTWSVTWSECSSTCGGGVQEGTVSCKQEGPEGVSYLSQEFCHYPMPDSIQSCNTEPCPQWHITNWTECSRTCGVGVRFRTVECLDSQREVTSGCSLPHPPRETPCLTKVVCIAQRHDPIEYITEGYHHEDLESQPSYSFSNWSSCSVSCGVGKRTRNVACRLFVSHDETFLDIPMSECSYQDMPISEEQCEMPPCGTVMDMTTTRHTESDIADETTTFGMTTSDPTETLNSPSEQYVTGVRLDGIHHIQEDQPQPPRGSHKQGSKSGSRGNKHAESSLSLSFDVDLDSESSFSVDSEYTDEGYGSASTGDQRYVWQQTGFNDCSSSCAGGTQESMIECIDTLNNGVVKDHRCHRSQPMERIRRMCNEQPCPSEWRVLISSECSHTCGRGFRYPRKVICLRVIDERTEDVLPLPDSDCENLPRPQPTSCANFECPPYWVMNMWSSCTEVCGRGTRSRMVKCKQVLGNGQEVERPSTSCPGQPPAETETCNEIDCSPSWLTGEFSECSSTCGPGQRVRAVECVQVLADGSTDMIDSSLCQPETKPTATQPCLMAVCFEPRIVTNSTSYVQNDLEGKIFLTVGQRATMFTKTSLVVRCLVEGLHKPEVQWLKGPIIIPRNNSVRVRAITGGSLKFARLEVIDSGVYTCNAGELSEDFYLTVVPPHQLAPDVERNYLWTLGEWSECTATCDGGIRRRDVLCQHVNSRGIDGFSAPERCAEQGLFKPLDAELCNRHRCSPHWVVSSWSQCSGVVCPGLGIGTKTRDVRCMNSSGVYVSGVACDSVPELIRPSNISRCHTDLCIPKWHHSSWDQCSATCGGGTRKRRVLCMYRNTKKKADTELCMSVTDPPPKFEDCNMDECGVQQSECTDEIRYCSVVLKVNSCDQPHYQRSCCASCSRVANTIK